MDPRVADSIDAHPGEAVRHPTLTPAGRAMLRRLAEHEAAPRFTGRSGSRLTLKDLEDVVRFDRETLHAPFDWRPGVPPSWMTRHIAEVYASVPHYRAMGSPPSRLADVEPVGRADLSADIAAFVSDDAAVERLITYSTSGTTGHPLRTPSHPVVAARYQTFHKRALRRFGVSPRAGAGDVGVVLLGMQRRCFTYVSVTPTLDEAGLAKINLHPDAWRDPADRARYLDALAPELLAGDPISFAELLELPVSLRPRALMSVSMMLTTGLRSRLEQRFGCPVLDLYSMNEVGPIGVWDAQSRGHVLLQPGLYVEIVGPDGRALPPGQRGEVCVSGGFNFCLPLLRYLTGDYAALSSQAGEPVLVGLAGRRPIRFRTVAGGWVNNVDVSHALESLCAAQFALHQSATGALTLRLPPGAMGELGLARALLHGLLGELPVMVMPIQADDKVLQYTSELAPV